MNVPQWVWYEMLRRGDEAQRAYEQAKDTLDIGREEYCRRYLENYRPALCWSAT